MWFIWWLVTQFENAALVRLHFFYGVIYRKVSKA
jgi:hypothetical protein